MILLDTCTILFDALEPNKLSTVAKRVISQAERKGQLYCSDISLWEIAMLVQKKRVDPGTDVQTFLNLTLQARQMKVLSITPEIAALSISNTMFNHFDPADRIIAATAISHNIKLITCDNKLSKIPDLSVIW